MSRSSLVRYRVLITALAAATALSACSSTNSKKAGGDDAAGDLGASAAPSSAAPVLKGANGKTLTKQQIIAAVKAGTLPKSALKSVASAPSGTSGGGSTTTSGGSGTKPGGTTAAGGAPKLSSGPGFSATEIKVGISLFKVGDAGKQFGIDASYGDGEKQAQAVVDYVNSKGGIAGRKVKPVYYTVDFGRAGSIQDGQFEAEACEKWTNDERVFAAINNSMARQALLTCLGKKGVPGIHDGMPIDEKRLAPYRDFYYSGVGGAAMTVDRTATVLAKVLGARGFYKDESPAKPTVVGIIHYNDEFYGSVVKNKLVPLIKSFGVKKVVVQAAPRGGLEPDSTYVARFKSEGVTHVQFLGEANGYPLFFMPAAENQQYRPKYGISTEQSPGFLQATGPIPREQLKNVSAIGWSQILDVDNEHDPGPVGPNDKLCLDIQKKAGQNMADRGARVTATVYCNGLFFLKQNLAGAAGTLGVPALAQAVSGLGSNYGSPGIFNPASYSGFKHDGATTYRDLAFKDGAFVYTSGNKRMPG